MIAKWNKREVPRDVVAVTLDAIEESSATLLDIFRTKTLLVYSLAQAFAWFSIELVKKYLDEYLNCEVPPHKTFTYKR